MLAARLPLFVWRYVLAALVGLPLLTVLGYARHQEGVINTTWDGVAIKGYDAVAYFTEGRATRGDEAFTHEWLHAKWLFASKKHKDLFASDPLRYIPQHGGYCSDAVYTDNKADIDPTAWRIVNGRLYIFYSEQGAAQWSTDAQAVENTDAEWERVKAGLNR